MGHRWEIPATKQLGYVQTTAKLSTSSTKNDLSLEAPQVLEINKRHCLIKQVESIILNKY